MTIGIEDFCEDIVGKAMRGTNMSDTDLAAMAAVDVESIQRLRRGEGDADTVRAVAKPLGLHPEKLVDTFNGAWYPQDQDVDGVFMVNTAFSEMFVNAYLIWDTVSREGAFFDTGADASELLSKAEEEKITVSKVFLTHTHRDHVADLDRVKAIYPEVAVHVGSRELFQGAGSVEHGDVFDVGALKVSARLTWGHAKGGISYVIDGLVTPIAVVGDAMFAGSMGGGMVSYQDALRTNREEILALPDHTILCPGHGPLTTVGEEKDHNPFF